MFRKILFLFYLIILLLSFFTEIKILGYPLQTFLIVFSLVIGLFIFEKSSLEIIKHEKYVYLRYYFLFNFSLIFIIIMNDLMNDKVEGILRSVSILIYLLYSVILVYLLKNRKTLIQLITVFYLVLGIYILVYIFNFSNDKLIDFFIFNRRTNLAWFILFLYVITLKRFSKNIEQLKTLIVFGVLLFNSSRSPIIVFVLVNIYVYKKILFTKRILKFILIGLPILLFIFYLVQDNLSLTIERLSNITNIDYRSSTSYRISVIIDGFNESLNNFWGNGYNSFKPIFNEVSRLDLSTKYDEIGADNSYIEILFDAGWIPIILLIPFFYKIYRSNERNKIFLIFLSTLMLFDSIIYNNFWTLLIISFLIINANLSKSTKRLYL